MTAIAYGGYIFLILPTLIVMPLSFGSGTEMHFPPSSFSLEQYRVFFLEGNWWGATSLSFWIALSAMVLSILIGVPTAYALVRADFRGKAAVTVIMLSPMFVPVVVIALGLYIYFSAIGITGPFLPIVFGHTLIAFPYVVVTCMAGMQGIKQNLEIAAEIMGGSRLYVFRRVTMPLLMPSVVAGGMFAFLISFDEVIIAYFVGRAGFTTLPVKMFAAIQWDISPVIAAISTLLTVLSLVICFVAAVVSKAR
jgi:putative spermidine/putrescine transport system permease protein